jgi:hypothetical protein
MGMISIFERGGDDVRRFDESMKRAKSGLMEACEIWQDMKDQFSERGGRYSERYNERYDERDRYYGRDWDDMHERRYRDSMGRYR